MLKKSTKTILWFIIKEHAAYNLIFTAIGVYFIISFGISSFFYVFWLKIFGLLAISTYWYLMRSKFLYFFFNLGASLKKLIAYALIVDTVSSILIFTLTYKLVH